MTDIKEKESLSSPVFSISNKLTRVLWGAIYNCFFRFSPTPFFAYRRWLVKAFGASIDSKVNIYPSARIWLPSNLTMEKGSTLGPSVNIYNQGHITIGANTIISQGAHLCASTHNYNNSLHPLILSPIIIGNNVWVCADAFIGPGVTLKEGTVVGARSVISRSSEAWKVYAGNPAKVVNTRVRF